MKSRTQAGFSVMEALIALLLLAAALAMGMSLYWQQSRALQRLRAQEEATRAIEIALETVRGSVVPLTTFRLTGIDLGPGPKTAKDLALGLVVEEAEEDDLYRVTVRADYTVLGEATSREVETLFWRPIGGLPLESAPVGAGR